MTKTLIVYFSHVGENYVSGNIIDLKIGNTEVIAKEIQSLTDGDLFKIEPLHPYPYKYHECTDIAKKELNHNERPKITNVLNHIQDYENIYLGYPSWWGTMPMCVWTFLEEYDLTDKNIYPFCTHEGSQMGKSVEDIKKLCPQSHIKKSFAIYGSQVHRAQEQVKNWIKENI
ncbi:MAG: flavodoxin [Coprobacillus sp.]